MSTKKLSKDPKNVAARARRADTNKKAAEREAAHKAGGQAAADAKEVDSTPGIGMAMAPSPEQQEKWKREQQEAERRSAHLENTRYEGRLDASYGAHRAAAVAPIVDELVANLTRRSGRTVIVVV